MGEITISVDEYKNLLMISARVEAFSNFVKCSKYDISKQECASFLGFVYENEVGGHE